MKNRSTAFLLTLLIFSGTSLKSQEFDVIPAVPLTGRWYTPSEPAKAGSPFTDPYIVNAISQVSADSMRTTLLHLQNFGTRFMLSDNRKDVAEWILGRFVSYGYTNVRLDSFLNYLNWGGGAFVDTTWQYNIVCTLPGSSAPDEEYLIGGHYDSYCYGNPYEYAPGVNDNGTAVAATLEIARIMAKENYQPEATIKFTLFAAEELGLWGSRYQAAKARETGEDVRYYINLDMISNNPDSTDDVKIYRYTYFEWASDLMADVFNRYTTLNVFFPAFMNSQGSDSFSYWMFGFPATYLEEFNFSPNWHQTGDVIDNCNVAYCAEITRGAMATLMEQQIMPYPQGIEANSSKDGITISWRPENNANVTGTNIYRSENIHTGFTRLNTQPLTDTLFVDEAIPTAKEYFYRIAFTDALLQESIPSTIVSGARFGFTDTLLVVACLKGNNSTPDSVVAFYNAVLDTIPYRWVDMNTSNPLDLGLLAKSQNVLWLLNSNDYDLPNDTLGNKLYTFFANGGNMMFAGITPSKYWAGNTTYPFKFSDHYAINYWFKVDSVNRRINSFMYRAYPESGSGYDTIRIDTAKYMEKAFPGEIYNVEVFTPAEGGSSIFRFDSHYPSNTSMGASQGKTVGIEYMGDDFRTIMLSFPLWYLDTSDARNLMKYVMRDKFHHPTAIPGETKQIGLVLNQNFPNPFRETTTITFSLNVTSVVQLYICNMQGEVVQQLFNRKMEKGLHTQQFSSGNLPSGVYQICLRSSSGIDVKKMVIIR